MLRFLLTLLVVALGCSGARAQARPKPLSQQLTARGRIMPSGSIGGFWSNDAAYLGGTYANWTLHANPAATYFVLDNLGVTLALQGAYSAGDLVPPGSFKEREVGIAGGVRWNVSLGERWSLLVSPLFGYTHAWSTTRVKTFRYDIDTPVPAGFSSFSAVTRRTQHGVGVALNLPFLFALNDSVAIGLGPDLSYDYLFGGQSHTRVLDMTLSSRRNGRAHRLMLGASVGVYGSF